MATSPTGVTYSPNQILGRLVASADYSSAQTYVFMKCGSTEGQVTTAGTGEQAIGIRINKPAQYAPVELVVSGTAPLKLGSGGATFGDELKSDSSGYGVASTADREKINAIALETGSENDEIEVLIVHYDSSHA